MDSTIDYEKPRKARSWNGVIHNWVPTYIIGKCAHNKLAPNQDNCAICGASGYEVFQETGKTFSQIIKEYKQVAE